VREGTSGLGVRPQAAPPGTTGAARWVQRILVDRFGPHHDKTVRILGTHGVPASYGGFETAAENVALFLRDQGWRVVVYCQVEGRGPVTTDTWRGLQRVLVPVDREGWLGTSEFDWRSITHAAAHDDICLTFGYNTAVFNVVQRVLGIPNVINMDGIEWSRARWGKLRQAILYTNERIGCVVGNRLIADHPVIATYLRGRAPARKITTVTYGAHAVTDAPTDLVTAYGLTPGRYLTLVARPIPENSILEIVQGFSRRHRGVDLVVLGGYKPEVDDYHRAVQAAASDEVRFPGGIYDADVVSALRFHSLAYVHGHTVGGTNPSLVEALGAGNPVIAHDNPYNRWVAQDAALWFSTPDDVDAAVDRLVADPALVARLGAAARARHASEFTWEHVAGQYEELLLPYVGATTEPLEERP
jgi:glycosyltransferase involved in cell wall biosynthesis